MDLTRVDELLMRLRAAQQRPNYRRLVLGDASALGGVTGLRVLRVIERAVDAAPTIRDVAKDLGVEHSTASRAVDDVVRRGLVDKSACADDMRKTRLALTADGRSVLDGANSRRRAMLARITREWSDDDVERLATLLAALVSGYDEIERDGGYEGTEDGGRSDG